MRGQRVILTLLLGALALALLAGCTAPKRDISIFMLPKEGLTHQAAVALEDRLIEALGESPTVALLGVPLYMEDKIMAEFAIRKHSIFILPRDIFDTFGKDGSFLPLDDVLPAGQYPDGMMTARIPGGQGEQTRLFGLPLKDSAWLAHGGLEGRDLVAFIPVNAANQEQAKQVLLAISEM